MEFTSEILQSLAKRAWKLIWILVVNIIMSFILIGFVVFSQSIFSLEAISKIDENILKIIIFLFQNILWSFILYAIFYTLKGDSDQTIKKLREKYYEKAIYRVKTVFEYRYSFPKDKYDKTQTIKKLTEYHKTYRKDEEHKIILENLNHFIVEGVDTLYIIYNINENESILFSVWHSGDFVAVAVAIKIKKVDENSEDKIKLFYEKKLNLSSAKEYTLSIRDEFWWFDIKYEVSDEFLFNNIEQEKISRTIAHIVTVGLDPALELMGWIKDEGSKNC